MTNRTRKVGRKSLLETWRQRRAENLLPGEGIQTHAPMPPGEAAPVNETTPSSTRSKDPGGRPLAPGHRKAPIGGPFGAH